MKRRRAFATETTNVIFYISHIVLKVFQTYFIIHSILGEDTFETIQEYAKDSKKKATKKIKEAAEATNEATKNLKRKVTEL